MALHKHGKRKSKKGTHTKNAMVGGVGPKKPKKKKKA